MPRHSEATLAAIKNAVDIVALVGEYLPLHRSGSKFKALCPFHDDHNPSLELNPDRQSYKCWSCGAGRRRLRFREGLRAGRISPRRCACWPNGPVSPWKARPPGRRDPRAVQERAVRRQRLGRAGVRRGAGPIARGAGICRTARDQRRESSRGSARATPPSGRDWLTRAGPAGRDIAADLPGAGGADRPVRDESPGSARERFRGRLIFPIHDPRGRTLGFGGRILPAVEQSPGRVGKACR